MPNNRFDAPALEITLQTASVTLSKTPYLHNDGGVPRYVEAPPPGAVLIPTMPTDPRQAIGREHVVPDIISTTNNAPYGIETQIAIEAETVGYDPIWATRTTAAAFGITLVKPGEAVHIDSPVDELSQNEYEYGVFAGHWSPYQGTGDELLSMVITDLEHHDFPHVFAATDPAIPLVISVARYWPHRGVMRCADLWVPQGQMLYIPPKPHIPDAEVVDLHNNRNSARAAWGQLSPRSITTHTLLQQTGGFFYWYWNARDTDHGRPSEGNRP